MCSIIQTRNVVKQMQKFSTQCSKQNFVECYFRLHCAMMMIKALFWLHSRSTRRRKVIMEPQASSGLSKVSCVCRSLSRGIFGHVKPLCRRFARLRYTLFTAWCISYFSLLPAGPAAAWEAENAVYRKRGTLISP